MEKRKHLEEAERLFKQALDLYRQGRFNEAIKKWEASKTICSRLKIPQQVADIEVNIGIALYDLGKHTEAVKRFEAAKTIYERLSMPQRAALAEAHIGANLHSVGRHAEAIRHLEAARRLYETSEMSETVANVELNFGAALCALRRHAEAIEHFETAKTIYEKLKSEADVAEMEMRIGTALDILDRPAEAIGHFEAAKTAYGRLNIPERVAAIDLGIGTTLGKLGRHEEAIEKWKAAKPILKKLKMEASIADAEINIGSSLHALGRPAQAMEHYEVDKTIYKTLDMEASVADVEVNIGSALSRLGRRDEAMKHYETAKAVYERLKREADAAEVEMNIGAVLGKLGRHEEAIEKWKAAKAILKRLKREATVASIEMNIGIALDSLGRPAEAIEHFRTARPIFEKLRMPHKVADIEINIGEALETMGRPGEAMKMHESALAVYEDQGLLMEKSRAYGGMGRTSAALGDLESALRYLDRAFELMERVRAGIRSPELQRSLREQYLSLSYALCSAYRLLWLLEGDSEHLDRALNAVELAKCTSVAESLEAGDAGVTCPEMEKLITEQDQLLKEAQNNYVELEELRELRMDGKITRDRFGSSLADWERRHDSVYERIERLRSEILVKCADVGNTPVPRTYNVLRRTLEVFPRDERWIILEFTMMRGLIVFLVDQDGSIQCVRHDIDPGKVEDLVFTCQGIVEKVRSHKREKADEELDTLSRQLYAALIPQQIAEALKSRDVEHVIVVPHRFLHWVPFEALFDGDDYWGLKYAISTDFSLDLARLCVEKRKKRAARLEEIPYVLMVKNPLLDLEEADKEVDGVVNLLNATRTQHAALPHEKATQPAFIEAVNERPFNILHYAGHAMFTGKDPSLSHLSLHTDEECPGCSGRTEYHTPDPLAATEIIHKVKFKRTPIVYLSACESGVAEVERGDEMFGLVRALMYAGATSFVLSRWPVRDEIAPIFAEEFYRQLLGGESVAVALWNARRKVFNAGPDKFTDWAVFSLQGDPFRRFA